MTADKKYENRKILGLSTDNITCSNVMDKKVNTSTMIIQQVQDSPFTGNVN